MSALSEKDAERLTFLDGLCEVMGRRKVQHVAIDGWSVTLAPHAFMDAYLPASDAAGKQQAEDEAMPGAKDEEYETVNGVRVRADILYNGN